MDGIYKLKVHGGKLVIVKIGYSDRIERIQILGDFFIHPEESLGLIEASLIGLPARSTREKLSGAVREVAEMEGIEMIGITPDAIAEAALLAMA